MRRITSLYMILEGTKENLRRKSSLKSDFHIYFFYEVHSFCLGLLKNMFSCVGMERHHLQNLVHNQVTKAITCKFSSSVKFVNLDLLFSPFFILLI